MWTRARQREAIACARDRITARMAATAGSPMPANVANEPARAESNEPNERTYEPRTYESAGIGVSSFRLFTLVKQSCVRMAILNNVTCKHAALTHAQLRH